MNTLEHTVYAFAFAYRWRLWRGYARKLVARKVWALGLDCSPTDLDDYAANVVARAWDRLRKPHNRTDNPERDISVALRMCVRAYRVEFHEKPHRYRDAADLASNPELKAFATVVAKAHTLQRKPAKPGPYNRVGSHAQARRWIRLHVPRQHWQVCLAVTLAGSFRAAADRYGLQQKPTYRACAELRELLLPYLGKI